MGELLPLDSLVHALKCIVPDAEWVLGEIESNNGFLRCPRFIQNLLNNPQIAKYPQLYENESAIWYCFARAFFSHDQIVEASQELEAASLAERGADLREIFDGVGAAVERFGGPERAKRAARGIRLCFRGATGVAGQYEVLAEGCEGLRAPGLPLARSAAHLGVTARPGGHAAQRATGDGRVGVLRDGAAVCAPVGGASATARRADCGGKWLGWRGCRRDHYKPATAGPPEGSPAA